MDVASDHKKITSMASDRRRRRLEIRRARAAQTGVGSRREMKNLAVRCFGSNLSRGLQGAASPFTPEPVQTGSLMMPPPFYGVASVIGKRRDMEDAVKVALGFTKAANDEPASSGHEYDFFAVYDGHGGAQVAHKCRDRMHVIMAEEVAGRCARTELSEFVLWEDAMAESFRRVDAEVATKKEIICDGVNVGSSETVGSTALVAVLSERRIVVANCGDSRAVLSRGGKAMALSCDHKPNKPAEMQRVEEAGGKVIEWDGFRVWGILATSRSIGDYYLKPCVTCEPEVTVMERLDEDEFLILASDGLWDVISNEMACKLVRNCLCGRSSADVATLLTEIAISRGSKDNISVIVVQLSSIRTRRSV